MVNKENFLVYITGVKKTYKALEKLEEVFPYVWEGSDISASFNDSTRTAYLLFGDLPLFDEKYSFFEVDFSEMLTLGEVPEKEFRNWGDFYDYWAKFISEEEGEER